MQKILRQNTKLIAYPFQGGQPLNGCAQSTQLIANRYNRNQVQVVMPTCGLSNAKYPVQQVQEGFVKNYDNVMRSSELLQMEVESSLKNRQFTIVLGGDHSQSIGSIAALKRVYNSAKVIWIDAHLDANSFQSSRSHNMHGMPISLLTGTQKIKNTQLNGQEQRIGCLSFNELVYFGIRSFESIEHQLVTDNNVLCFTPQQCHQMNIHEVKRQIDNYLFPDGMRSPLWISLDVDAIDFSQFISTGTPESAGLTIVFIKRLLIQLLPFAVGIDISEVNFFNDRITPTQRDRDFTTVLELIDLASDNHNMQGSPRCGI